MIDIPSQELESSLYKYPSVHSHLNEPTEFTHLPFSQMPGIASHSSTSVKDKY